MDAYLVMSPLLFGGMELDCFGFHDMKSPHHASCLENLEQKK
jgi:hypothetical protein